MKLNTETPKQQTIVCLYHINLLFIFNVSLEPSPSPLLLSFLHTYETDKASNKTKCNDPQNPRMKMDLRRKSMLEPGACMMEDELETMAATPLCWLEKFFLDLWVFAGIISPQTGRKNRTRDKVPPNKQVSVAKGLWRLNQNTYSSLEYHIFVNLIPKQKYFSIGSLLIGHLWNHQLSPYNFPFNLKLIIKPESFFFLKQSFFCCRISWWG